MARERMLAKVFRFVAKFILGGQECAPKPATSHMQTVVGHFTIVWTMDSR
jgi:hypothetical protein